MQIKTITKFRAGVQKELYENIAPFWINHTIDSNFGGFYGRISNDLKVEKQARKSLILTARVLWFFSAMYRLVQKGDYLKMAKQGYAFLIEKFLDEKYGGTYWLVDNEGSVLNTKKKIYGQAFSIYALVEYYSATEDQEALNNAIKIFELIENNNHDEENQGYLEASNRDWSTTEEMQLSEVDMNEVKSMNTHLHLVEAYTALFKVWEDNRLRLRLEELVHVFTNFIIDPVTCHLNLFFDEHWNVKSSNISFGHDIETSWLLYETVEVLGDQNLKDEVTSLVIKMVDITLKEGFSEKNAIYTEMNQDGTICKNIQWWQQAEAIVGLLNAFNISGDESYLLSAQRAWDFIEYYFVDKKNGEWFYEIDENCEPGQSYNKVSEWKGPYHNGRACIEILRRLS